MLNRVHQTGAWRKTAGCHQAIIPGSAAGCADVKIQAAHPGRAAPGLLLLRGSSVVPLLLANDIPEAEQKTYRKRNYTRAPGQILRAVAEASLSSAYVLACCNCMSTRPPRTVIIWSRGISLGCNRLWFGARLMDKVRFELRSRQ